MSAIPGLFGVPASTGGGGGGGGAPSGPAGGNLSGTYPNPTVAKVNGTTVPAGGLLTTGNAPYVSGLSALTYSALNLAGGSGWVTGALPVGNVAPGSAATVLVTNAGATAPAWVAFSGDATIAATGAVTNAKINGTSVPAGGSLTTGNAAYVSGSAAATYSALNLAGGSGWVTGTLPLGNVASPTSTGLAKVSGGSWVGAAATLVDADVDAAAAIAGTKVSPNFGSQNIVTTGALSVKANPASAGDVRLGAGAVCKGRDASNAFDVQVFVVGASGGNITVGDSTNGSSLIVAPLTSAFMRCGGSVDVCTFVAANLLMAKPIIGDTTYSSPYGVHGAVSMVSATGSLTSAQYKFPYIILTGTPGSTQTLTVPNPASAAAAYKLSFRNTSNASVTITCGAGNTITIATLRLATVRVENSNVWRETADVDYTT